MPWIKKEEYDEWQKWDNADTYVLVETDTGEVVWYFQAADQPPEKFAQDFLASGSEVHVIGDLIKARRLHVRPAGDD